MSAQKVYKTPKYIYPKYETLKLSNKILKKITDFSYEDILMASHSILIIEFMLIFYIMMLAYIGETLYVLFTKKNYMFIYPKKKKTGKVLLFKYS